MLTLLVYPAILLAGDDDSTYTFRNTKWGMTKQEVIRSEGNKEIQVNDKKGLTYLDTIATKEFQLWYHFVDNKLVLAAYALMEEHTNSNKYIEDYEEMKDLLIKEYGDPKDTWFNGEEYSEMAWSNDLYKNEPQHWGTAVSIGHLDFQCCWETTETEITLRLTGDNYKLNLLIAYRSKEFKDLMDKDKKKEVKEKL